MREMFFIFHYKEVHIMTVKEVRDALIDSVSELAQSPQLFLKNPGKAFTRKRKLSFYDTVSILLSMEGKSTGNELLEYQFQLLSQVSALLPGISLQRNYESIEDRISD